MLRDGRARTRRSLQRLRADLPGVRWLLVREHPRYVLAVALRQVGPRAATAGGHDVGTVGGTRVPEVRGTDGHQLLRGLRAATASGPG